MRSKHGFKFISKLPIENIPMLHEAIVEYANKPIPSENDRSKNITYTLPKIGKATVSHATGTVTIDTEMDEKTLIEAMKKWISRNAYESFKETLSCPEAGAHFRKFHGTVGYVLDVKKPGKIPIFLSVRGCNRYVDIHIKVPWKMVDIKNFSKKDYTASTSSPARRYVSDAGILDLVKERDVVGTKDCSAVNLSESAFYRRLEKLRNQDKLSRTSKYPALYMIKPVILQKTQQDLNSQKTKIQE